MRGVGQSETEIIGVEGEGLGRDDALVVDGVDAVTEGEFVDEPSGCWVRAHPSRSRESRRACAAEVLVRVMVWLCSGFDGVMVKEADTELMFLISCTVSDTAHRAGRSASCSYWTSRSKVQ